MKHTNHAYNLWCIYYNKGIPRMSIVGNFIKSLNLVGQTHLIIMQPLEAATAQVKQTRLGKEIPPLYYKAIS